MNSDYGYSKRKVYWCLHFLKHGNCNYGKECHYAHSLYELSINPCKFNNKCTKIIENNGVIENSSNVDVVCMFCHENSNKQLETTPQFLKRIGVNVNNHMDVYRYIRSCEEFEARRRASNK